MRDRAPYLMIIFDDRALGQLERYGWHMV